MGRQVKHIITLLLVGGLLSLMCANCGGHADVADCRVFGPDSTYCHWPLSGRDAGICCPGSHPYCGRDGTNCPAGKCCNAPPLSLGLKPL